MKTYKFLLAILFYPFLTINGQNSLCSEIPQVAEVGANALPVQIVPIKKSPFEMPQLQRPMFPSLTINITDRGALETLPITDIVNYTIKEVYQKGGGTVLIPKGKWKSGRIILKSNVNLHLAEGAEVEFSGTIESYSPPVFMRHEGIEVMGAGAFIYANGENNIAITGKGIIYGPPMTAEIRKRPNGNTVVENDIIAETPIEKRIVDGKDGRIFYKPKSIAPIYCTNVLIEGVTLERSTHWNVCPIYCENVIIRGITVNSTQIPSGDGIDIESCKNVLIEYCTLNCGDDCFTLKAGRAEDGLRVGKPTENVIIRYSLAKEGHGGITCGSETAGGIKNIYLHDCVFDGTRTGVRFKTRRTRGGGIDGIWYERIRMIRVGEAFQWDLLGSAKYMGKLSQRYPIQPITRLTPIVRNIHIRNFIIESANKIFNAHGIPEIPCRNIWIEKGKISSLNDIGTLNDMNGFTLKDIDIICKKGNRLSILDSQNILFEDVSFTTLTGNLLIDIKGDKSKNIIYKQSGKSLKCFLEQMIKVKTLTSK